MDSQYFSCPAKIIISGMYHAFLDFEIAWLTASQFTLTDVQMNLESLAASKDHSIILATSKIM